MATSTIDSTAAVAEVQSKRPALNHRASDHSDTNTNTTSNAPQPRAKHQKQRRVGGLHGRVPSSNKGLHKQHASSSKVNLKSRVSSPADHEHQIPQRPVPPHRRATSEVKIAHNSSSGNVAKPPAQPNLKRNRSHVEVSKRNRSSEKLKRSSSGSGVNQLNKSSKSQVHFDLGSDDQEEDEWVDASGSNSPYLSRKGSLNSSTHSSGKPGESATSSRPQSPNEPELAQPNQPSSLERTVAQHKELLTSKLLQRSAPSSQVAPPKMSTDIAQAAPSAHTSPPSTGHDTPPPPRSHEEGLTSRFVEGLGSGIASQGSFFNASRTAGGSHRSEELPRRSFSVTNFSRSHEYPDAPYATDNENSALVPRQAKRPSAPAEASRTQQKLNLQRASSTIEPGQAVAGGGVVGVIGASPLIGVGDAGHDGGHSRDPRVGKLLERHGMEYLVVRRYQNPVARSLNRLGRLESLEKTRRIPRTNTSSTIASRRSVDPSIRHMRNVSLPEDRSATSQRQSATVKTNGTKPIVEGDEVHRLSERLSGSSLVAREEEDGTAILLRNLWERPLDLSASTD